MHRAYELGLKQNLNSIQVDFARRIGQAVRGIRRALQAGPPKSPPGRRALRE